MTEKLSVQLKQAHDCGDSGRALEGYWEMAKALEDEITELKAEIEDPGYQLKDSCED